MKKLVRVLVLSCVVVGTLPASSGTAQGAASCEALLQIAACIGNHIRECVWNDGTPGRCYCFSNQTVCS